MRNLYKNNEHLEYFLPSVPLYIREQKYYMSGQIGHPGQLRKGWRCRTYATFTEEKDVNVLREGRATK